MSDSNVFCQLKFNFSYRKCLLAFMLSFMLFSCGGNNGGSFDQSDYDKTGIAPTRFVPYRQPSYRPSYPSYQRPYSRSYQNPYEFQHRNPYYPTYYDQDQYYVPPTNYRNVEPDFDFGADQKS